MNLSLFILTIVLILTLLAPFVALYAVSFIKKKDFAKHAKIQKQLFWICVTAVLILELHIRISGGSGSLVVNSTFAGTAFLKYVLVAHIIGAILTYLLWAINIFWSGSKFRKKLTLPGVSSKTHKKLGFITILGLFYTAITALMVYLMAFIL